MSCVQLNVLDTLLPLPAASVNLFELTTTEGDIVEGMHNALYTVELDAFQFDKVQFVRVTSANVKLVVDSLAVNINVTLLLLVPPLDTSDDVIVIDGGVLSVECVMFNVSETNINKLLENFNLNLISLFKNKGFVT